MEEYMHRLKTSQNCVDQFTTTFIFQTMSMQMLHFPDTVTDRWSLMFYNIFSQVLSIVDNRLLRIGVHNITEDYIKG